MRTVRLTPNYTSMPEGSVLIEVGHTRVLCNGNRRKRSARVAQEQRPRLGDCGIRHAPQGHIDPDAARIRAGQSRRADP